MRHSINFSHRPRIRWCVITAIALVWQISHVLNAGAAEFIPLGIMGIGIDHGIERHESHSYHISDDGRIVMGRTSGPLWSSPVGGVFRWTRETGMAPLDSSEQLRSTPRMSADGSAIAWLAGPTGGNEHSRVWSEGSGLTVFNDPGNLEYPAYVRNQWLDVERPNNNKIFSADGRVIVGRRDGSVVRWSLGGGFENLGILSPQRTRYHQDTLVSDDGNVIVGTLQTEGEPRTIFVWTADGGVINIGAIPGANWYAISDISNDGSAFVGVSRVVEDEDYTSSPASLMRWTRENGPVVLQAGTTQMQFRDDRMHLSGDGSVIAGERHSADFTEREAFRWTDEKGFQTLLLPGYTQSTVYDLTPDGKWILGASISPTDPSRNTLMLWSEETGLLDLRHVLAAQGLSAITASWGLARPSYEGDFPQISADGRSIAATGTNPTGDPEAWVLYLDPITTVPEPPGAALGFAALACLVAARRR
jgi:uncharacterized membrane protein